MKCKAILMVSIMALVLSAWGAMPAGRARAAGATYYSQGSLAPNLTTSWNTAGGGGGSSPSNFTSGDVFVIQNGHNMATTAVWIVSGSGATIQIESGGTLTGNNAVTVVTFQIDNGGKFIHNTGNAIVPGTTRSFAANSTYEIWNQGTAAISAGITWGNVIINLATDPGKAIGNAAAFATVNGSFTVQNTRGREYRLAKDQTTHHTIAGNLTVQNGGQLNLKSGTGAMIVNIGGNVSVETGGSLALTTSGMVSVNVSGNWTNSGTLTTGTSSVTFNKTGTATYGGSTTTTFNNVTINAGTTLDLGGNTFNVNGSVINNGALKQMKPVDGSVTPATVEFLYFGADKYHGVEIATSTNLGDVTVSIKGNQNPDCTTGPGSFVKRCFGISTTATPATANVKYWFTVDELNGIDLARLNVYHWATATGWTALGNDGTGSAGSDSYVQVNNVSSFSPFVLSTDLPTGPAPTAVYLASFTVARAGDHNVLTWETVSELHNLGFNIWRGTSVSAPTVKVNALLIPSQAPGGTDGYTYSYSDFDIVSGTNYIYWLDDVDLNGTVTRHGPVQATADGPAAITLTALQARSPDSVLPFVALGLALLAGAGITVGRHRR